LTYTGYLASGRDPAVGFAVAFIGLILIIKPAMWALRYYGTHFGRPPRPGVRKDGEKSPPKKTYLKVISSKSDKSDKSDKPTIH
jgi:hypothetical protein